MIHLGLIGYPLEHSLSPKIHNAALNACGLMGDYSLFLIAPNNQQALKDILARVRSGEIQGLNVTIPHKQNIIPLLDQLTPIAQAIGAVNTIYLREGILIGDNTDAPSFLSDLKRFIGNRELGNRESGLGSRFGLASTRARSAGTEVASAESFTVRSTPGSRVRPPGTSRF